MANPAQATPEITLEYGYSIATAAVIIIIGCVILGIIEHLTRKLLSRHSAQTGKVIRLLSVSLKILTGLLAFLTVLAVLKIDLTGVLTGLGLTSFALGYALKDAISNLLAGVMIIIYHPYSKGDYIEVSGCKGTVTEINLRYTVLVFEMAEYLVPNSLCMTNWLKKEKPVIPKSEDASMTVTSEESSPGQDSLDTENDKTENNSDAS